MKQQQSTPTDSPNTQTDMVAVTPSAASTGLATISDIETAVQSGKGLGDLKKLKVGTINMKTEYKSFEATGEMIRRVFLGFSQRQSIDPVTGEDKGMMPAAMLYDPESETINVCMQSVLVGVIREVNYPRGAALQITYKGDRKGKSGLKYQDFDIRALVPAQ